MTDTMLNSSAAGELQPIKVGLLETVRLARKSYTHPLEHAQELQARYGNVVMQKLLGANAHRLALVNERDSYCWVPFSGGAHMCIGLHFAIMQIKLVMFEMLRRYRWWVPAGYQMPVQQSPISKPRDGLPVFFERRA